MRQSRRAPARSLWAASPGAQNLQTDRGRDCPASTTRKKICPVASVRIRSRCSSRPLAYLYFAYLYFLISLQTDSMPVGKQKSCPPDSLEIWCATPAPCEIPCPRQPDRPPRDTSAPTGSEPPVPPDSN